MTMTEKFEKAFRACADRESAWWKNDRRGRWVVLEPSAGSFLGDVPAHVREYVDAVTERRGRRFASLGRARAFAREIGGEVRHWRRQMTRRVPALKLKVRATWKYETNPWARVSRQMPGLWISVDAEGSLEEAISSE